MKQRRVVRGWTEEQEMRFVEWQIRQHTDIPEEGVQRVLRDIRDMVAGKAVNGALPYKKVRGWP